MSERPTAIELFAGAGGLALGIQAAGYSVVHAIEKDQIAVDTLNRNREDFFASLPDTRPADITAVDPVEVMGETGLRVGELDLLAGGPPCVAFSKSGFYLEYKRLGQDPNARLLEQYLRFVDALRPRAFLMEEVPGLAYQNHSAPFFAALRDGLSQLGYSFTFSVLNAADYGVPQNRQRLFLIGTREPQPLGLPRPTHWGDHERRKRPKVADFLTGHLTAGEALAGVRAPSEDEEVVAGQYGHLLPEIPDGGNYLFFTEHEGYPRPLFRWRSRYWTFLLKLDPNRAASTIQAQPGPYVGPFHWENRRLRVPELKRLQGFPDDYDFAGTRRDIQRQIGNSVPPTLAMIIAESLRRQVDGGLEGLAEPVQSLLPIT